MLYVEILNSQCSSCNEVVNNVLSKAPTKTYLKNTKKTHTMEINEEAPNKHIF